MKKKPMSPMQQELLRRRASNLPHSSLRHAGTPTHLPTTPSPYPSFTQGPASCAHRSLCKGKCQSPVQQELLRRHTSNTSSSTKSLSSSSMSPLPPLPTPMDTTLSPTSSPSPVATAPGATSSTGCAPPPASNSLRRHASISPAAKDFVADIATCYGCSLRRRKALIVGIGYKGHKYLQELPGCRNDVVSMFKLLTGPLFGFEQSTVHILSDEVDRIGNVSVVAPTRINILQHMKWLTKDIVSGDSVVFFFAGHGEAVEDVSGDEIETGFDQCIMPVDYTPQPPQGSGKRTLKGVPPILDDTIYERLVRSVPDGAKVTAIIDACRSGTICDLPVIYDADGQARYRNGEKGPPRATSRPHLSAGGCVLFSGSMDHQLSADMTIDVHENGRTRRESFGIMTKSFVDAMVEMCALRDASRYCGVESWSYGTFLQRIRELVKIRAREHLPEYFEKQEPQLSSSHTLDVWNTFFAM